MVFILTKKTVINDPAIKNTNESKFFRDLRDDKICILNNKCFLYMSFLLRQKKRELLSRDKGSDVNTYISSFY